LIGGNTFHTGGAGTNDTSFFYQISEVIVHLAAIIPTLIFAMGGIGGGLDGSIVQKLTLFLP